MTHNHPDDTNAAMSDINMWPMALHKPRLLATSQPDVFLYPELEAAIIGVTHIKQGSMPLLILGCSSSPPCSFCGSVALFPSAHCSSQRARLPVDLPQASS